MSEVVKKSSSRGRAFTTDAAPAAQHKSGGKPPSDEVVVVAPQTELSTEFDYSEDAGAGMEDISQNEMLMPFVRIIQPTSGVLKESSPSYNPDVRQGMMYNTATGEFYSRPNGFGFVPCFRQSSYTEWVPVDDGGGFRGIWDHNDPRILQLLKQQGSYKALKTEAKTELIETFTIYGVVVPTNLSDDKSTVIWYYNQASPGVIAFTSTQIKKYRTLVTRLNALVGQPKPKFPMWCWRWHVTTNPEKNKKGDYYGWNFTLAEDTADASRLSKKDPTYMMARDLHYLISAGGAKADFATSGVAADIASQSDGTTIDATGSTGQVDAESDIPF